MTKYATREAAALDFAQRLQTRMIDKGMTQSDLMRATNKLLPVGHSMSRDSVSKYLRGRNIPNPIYITAIARALGMKPDDLLPSRGPLTREGSSDALAPFKMTEQGDGNVWVSINMAVPWGTALKLMELVKK
ncbi:MAG: helix-turn-helix domain-containing protein [Aestuariivirga sp.]